MIGLELNIIVSKIILNFLLVKYVIYEFVKSNNYDIQIKIMV